MDLRQPPRNSELFRRMYPWKRVTKDLPCKSCGGQRWFRINTTPFTFWCTNCDGELPR